ncbi:hypothetical protein LQW54_004817 [Pestalotiopsis sp. IQ-011]
MLSSIVTALALSLSTLVVGEEAVLAKRQILKTITQATTTTHATTTSTASATATCTTNAAGLASPQPSDAVCGSVSYSNGGTTLVSYNSGQYILSAALCGQICIETAYCTNIYFAEGQYCNLHSGAETHNPDASSPYTFYDATCFMCPSECSLASPQPSDAVCASVSYSNGGVTMSSYNYGPYIEGVISCGELCLATENCTNIYFEAQNYCNLHSGAETHNPDATSPYVFYDASCFTCPSRSSTSTTPATSTLTSTTTTKGMTTTSSATSVDTTSSLTTTAAPWTSIETDPAEYDMAVTTAFTQASECTGNHVTQMEYHGTNLWVNAINPVPTSTITNCYPSQFYSSVMGEINSVSLPAFSTLACPYGWSSTMYNETYGVCCPSGFRPYAPYYSDITDRPFYAAACTSALAPFQAYDLTSYDSSAFLTVVPTSAPSTGTFVRANAFDGRITATPSSTSTTVSSSSMSSATTCATPSPTVDVTFRISYAVANSFDGETIGIVGSTAELGSWNVSQGLNMSATFYTLSNPVWDLTVALNASEMIEYQYLYWDGNGTYTTSSDPYYNLTVSTGCSGTQSVRDTWR